MKAAAKFSRIRLSLIAAAAGWVTALAVTSPMQYAKIIANAIGGRRDLLWSLYLGTVIWGLWSLAIAAGGWLVGFIPLIVFARETWLLRHPRRWAIVAALLGWCVVLLEFQVWKLVRPYATLPVRMFILYTLLLVVFSTVSAAVYLRLLASRTTPGAPGTEAGAPGSQS